MSQPLGRVSIPSLITGAAASWIKVTVVLGVGVEFVQLLSAFILTSPEFADDVHQYTRLEFATCSLPRHAPIRKMLLLVGLNFADIFAFKTGYGILLALNLGMLLMDKFVIPSKRLFSPRLRRHCLDFQKVRRIMRSLL